MDSAIRRAFAVLLFWFVCSSFPAQSQVVGATLSGTLTDPSASGPVKFYEVQIIQSAARRQAVTRGKALISAFPLLPDARCRSEIRDCPVLPLASRLRLGSSLRSE